MTQKLTPSVLRVGELNLAGYQRPSKASSEVLQALGLNPDDENLVRIGSASVPEVVLLESTYIAKGESKTWDLTALEQDMCIDGVYPSSSESDSLKLELLTGDDIQFESVLNKNETFIASPVIVYGATHSLKITATENISFIQIVLKPVSVLDVITPVEVRNSRETLDERESLVS